MNKDQLQFLVDNFVDHICYIKKENDNGKIVYNLDLKYDSHHQYMTLTEKQYNALVELYGVDDGSLVPDEVDS